MHRLGPTPLGLTDVYPQHLLDVLHRRWLADLKALRTFASTDLEACIAVSLNTLKRG